MTLEQKVDMALSYTKMSMSELARQLGTSPQAFNQRLKRGKFTPDELENVAEKLGAKLVFHFEFPDGTKV